MSVHLIQDLGQEQLIAPFARAKAVCGSELSEAHEIVRPEAEADICPDCLSWSKRPGSRGPERRLRRRRAERRAGLAWRLRRG